MRLGPVTPILRLARDYKYATPGVEDATWGEWLLTVIDPFGNRPVFFQPKS